MIGELFNDLSNELFDKEDTGGRRIAGAFCAAATWLPVMNMVKSALTAPPPALKP